MKTGVLFIFCAAKVDGLWLFVQIRRATQFSFSFSQTGGRVERVGVGAATSSVLLSA
eukprot:COSAG03_NODE_16394_length_403_cov_0.641447_2_plen_56_part_01